MIKERHKLQKDENFPVAFCLFPKAFRQTVNAYYTFAREADDVADNPHLSAQEKLDILNHMENVLLGSKPQSKKYASAANLREIFVKENFSLSLATDLLKAFRQDAVGFEYQTWAQLTEYCRYSAAPVGRFLLALYNENPSTYLPAASLCAALQIVNHIQDIKYDACVLNRVYVPQEILRQFSLSVDDLKADTACPQLKNAVAFMMEKINGLLKEALLLPSIVQSRALKIEVFVIFYLTKYMINNLLKKDFLAREVKLSCFQRVSALIKGIIRGMFAQTKTVTNKGI